MKQVYFFGECMVELQKSGDSTMRQSFAGDVYNSAVYMKRCFPEMQTAMVTVAGNDDLSDSMLTTFADEGLSTDWVFRHPTKTLGLYLIETDAQGERSFVYWRSDSAARQIMEFLGPKTISQLTKGDVFFLSGIPLAILSDQAREQCFDMLRVLKAAGVKIVFDPNYRPTLWSSEQCARDSYSVAMSLADIALPGVEDFTVLFGIQHAIDVVAFCANRGVVETVVKNGPESVFTCLNGDIQEHLITPADNVVDTTSAGDAFNGVYLGARLLGHSIADSVQLGAAAAGVVIQFPGAIAPQQAFASSLAGRSVFSA